MIYSMTGFGRSEVRVKGTTINMEIKSINSRFCEIFIKMPIRYTVQEEMVKNIIKEDLHRGKIDVLVDISPKKNFRNEIEIDEDKLRGYLSVIRNMKEKFSIEGELNIQNILALDGVFRKKEDNEVVDRYWEGIKIALKKALKNIKESRREEGMSLEKDFKKRINLISNNLKCIEKIEKKRNKQIFKKLKEKANTLIKGINGIDKSRLEQEVALLSEKYDITEERVRLEHHNRFFLNTIKDGEIVGKKLEFTIQEMSREINTIGAKGNEFEISKYVINIKEEIEKIREQVRNIL